MRSTFSIKLFLALWPFLFCLSQAGEVVFSSLPSCAQGCINSTVTTPTCLPYSDASCLCQEAPLLGQTKQCWLTSCTRKEYLGALNTTSIVCDEPVEDKSDGYRKTVAVLYALVVTSVASHFAARSAAGLLKWVYDGNLFLIFFIATAIDVLSWRLAETGLGKHIWKVSDKDITSTLRYFYFVEIGYFTITGLLKLQFLVFYLQIFPDQLFRRIVSSVLAFQVVSLLPFVISAIFICTPIDFFWTSWSGNTSGTCINNNTLVLVHAGLSIFLDVVTLVLPMKPVWDLQLNTSKKIGLMLMFSVGACVTVVSIVRIPSLLSFATTLDTTWNYLETSRWSHLELHIAIICLCMPAMRLGFMRVARSVGLLSTGTGGKSYAGAYEPGGGRGPKDHDIHVQSTFRIGHASKGQMSDDERSFVQLVEIEGDKRTV